MIVFSLADSVPALNARLLGDSVTVTGCSTDTRSLHTGNLFIALRGKHFDGHQFLTEAAQQGAAALLVDRPCDSPLPQLIVDDTLVALGALARWWRERLPLRHVVAITGSNGKTTVKEMVGAILSTQGATFATQGNLNNDIGVPLTLFQLSPNHEYAVIEMGASTIGDIARLTQLAQPSVATITQCAPAHLEGFGDIEGVARTKGEIFQGLQPQGVSVINADDVFADFWRGLVSTLNQGSLNANYHASRPVMTFALDTPAADVTATHMQLTPNGSEFVLKTGVGEVPIRLALAGRHNVMNALNAAACALACGCSLEAIQQGLHNMPPVKGRLQLIAGLQGSVLLNDTYNANPTSLNAALMVLATYQTPRWLVLGDMKELGNRSVDFHQQAGRLARELGIDRVWTTGELAQYTAEAFGETARHFKEQSALIAALREALTTPVCILVKGSRSMQMEHVINALKAGD